MEFDTLFKNLIYKNRFRNRSIPTHFLSTLLKSGIIKYFSYEDGNIPFSKHLLNIIERGTATSIADFIKI